MNSVDYLVMAVILAILGAAAWYVYKAKKSGRKCIGCPDSSTCSGKAGCNGSCSGCKGCHKAQ